MTEPRHPFRAEIDDTVPGTLVLGLAGDEDLETLEVLEHALGMIAARRPRRVLVHAGRSDFISVRGLASIGRLSLDVDQLTLVSGSTASPTVLEMLGYHRVECSAPE